MATEQLPSGFIPEPLLKDFHKDDGVLFLGTDFPNLPSNDVPPGRSAFAARLAKTLPAHATADAKNPWDIAQRYEEQFDRHALIAALKAWLEETSQQSYSIYDTVARLPIKAIITTAYDDRLEQTLRAAGKSPVTVVNDVDVPFIDDDKVLVLKLFGDVNQPQSLVLTDDDQRNLKSRLAPLLSVVRYLFVIKTLCFAGYDLSDDLFKDLYAEVARGVTHFQRHSYAVWPVASDLDRRRWGKKGVELINDQPATFLADLLTQLNQLPVETKGKRQSLELLHRRPYKFLDYFEPADQEIFFGRETESLLLWRKILSYRLVVLFGPSGAGKTSLLNAGVWPRLKAYDYRVCSARVRLDPTQAVCEAVQQAVPIATQTDAGRLRLRSAREDLPSFLTRVLQPTDHLVILPDQFEELFVTASFEVQQHFLRDLAACVRDESREVRFVMSLREDFLPHLETYRDQLLQFHANSFLLTPLSRAAAELAITEPAFCVGLAYEPELVPRLLADLADDGCIAAPQLQIVCDRLYDHVMNVTPQTAAPTLAAHIETIFPLDQPAQAIHATITEEHYRDLGGAQTILADYVDDVIAALPEAQRDPARTLLKGMITAEETKAVLAQDEIIARARVEPELGSLVLKNLVDYRLVRQLGGEQGTLYELAHEHLIAKIRSWVSRPELDAEIARRLLDQQLRRYREFGGLIDIDTLARINAQWANPYLVITLPVELELIFCSALALGDASTPDWFTRAKASGLPVEAMAQEGLRSDNFRVRTAAVKALAQLGAQFIDCLTEMLADLYPQVRVAAIHALEELQPTGEWRKHLKYECYVPAGPFIMGDAKSDQKNEHPAHEVNLEALYIGRYPVTNADYKRYMDDAQQPWEMPAGKEQHPVVNVSWFDSRKYVWWASMRLLTEAEWEKAAAWGAGSKGQDARERKVGGPKRQYPWGNKFDTKKCNTSGSGIGTTTPVGKYSPQGDSPVGCADMAGNVWEWTSSLKAGYPYRADDGREDQSSSYTRVQRGGSFGSEASGARCASRNDFYPNYDWTNLGVRCGVGAAEEPLADSGQQSANSQSEEET